jgi:hypothetical protein
LEPELRLETELALMVRPMVVAALALEVLVVARRVAVEVLSSLLLAPAPSNPVVFRPGHKQCNLRLAGH